jgi:sugar/nucleoside kinase (ribokinase family)
MTHDILYVGSTTLDYVFPDRIGIISGSAARSAAATAMANPNHTKIGLVTTLGMGDSSQDSIRTIFREMGVHVFSQADAKIPISIYDEGYGQKPSRQFKKEDFVFLPHEAYTEVARSPRVAVFSGGQTIYNKQPMQRFAQSLAAKGSTIVLDINSRKPVAIEASRAWAQQAHIVKLATVDIPHMMDGSAETDAAAKTFLDWGKESPHGTRLVCVTMGGAGTKAYWYENNSIKTLTVPPSETLHVKDDVGAGDAFDAGVALACSELGITSHSIDTQLNEESVRQIVTRGNELAVHVLRVNNGPEQQRPAFCRSVTNGNALEDIVTSIYPAPKIAASSKEALTR